MATNEGKEVQYIFRNIFKNFFKLHSQQQVRSVTTKIVVYNFINIFNRIFGTVLFSMRKVTTVILDTNRYYVNLK